MPFLAGISSFFDKYILGYAIGTAAGPSLEPFVQDLANVAWEANQVKPVDPITAAAIVAEDVELNAWGVTQASQTGISADSFAAILGETLNAPGTGPLFEMWRRGLISTADFEHGLRKAKYETRWDAPLEGLHDTLLTSAELAMLQQQGFIDSARADSEGGLQGVTSERQQLRYEASGLPPGIVEGLQMLRRGIIDAATFAQIVREGHTKTKYTAQLQALEAQVLNHSDYVTARLRAWIDDQQMYAGGLLTGYQPADMDLLLKNHGRPLSWHQIFIGLRRGGVYDGPTTGIDPAFLKGMQESDIRPEWYNLAWAQRFTYPAAFILRTLTQAGDITAAQAEQILLYEGWEPTLAATVSAKWGAGTGTTATQKKQTLSHLTAEYLSGALTRAGLVTALTALGYTPQQVTDEINLAEFNASKAVRTKATTAIGKRYIALQLTQAEAETQMAALGWPQGAIDKYVAGWNAERDDEGTTLTKAEVVKAAKKGTLSQADALARLEVLGVAAADAQILLTDA